MEMELRQIQNLIWKHPVQAHVNSGHQSAVVRETVVQLATVAMTLRWNVNTQLEIPVWAHDDGGNLPAAVRNFVSWMVTVATILNWNVQLKLQVEHQVDHFSYPKINNTVTFIQR